MCRLTGRFAAETLLAFVDDILELSYLSSGQFKLTPSRVDLRQLAEDITEGLRESAEKKGLDLRLKVTGSLPASVEVDRLRLLQVLTNLLTNEIKYAETGLVTLAVIAEERKDRAMTVTFKVIDTGIGIAPADAERTFREFRRLDRAEVSREPGTGLGLAICRRILRAMDSDLSLESTVDRGSTFSFKIRLPVVDDGFLDDRARPLAGVTILYAEDEPVIRQVTARRLVEAGAEVIEASNGVEALDRMPKLSEVEVIGRLHEGDRSHPYPIFVLTSHISGTEAAEARAAGAKAVFTKPIQVAALAAAFRAQHGGLGRNTPNDSNRGAGTSKLLLDPTNFRDIVDGLDGPVLSALLDEFEASLRDDISKLQAAIDDSAFDEARMIAHRALGLCQVTGALALARILRSIEQTAAAERRPD